MQKVISAMERMGCKAMQCENALSRSFADVTPKIPRKNPEVAIPRKAKSGGKMARQQMNQKVAYVVGGTAGAIAGLLIYEGYRSVKCNNSMFQQLQIDLRSVKESFVPLFDSSQQTSNDLLPPKVGADGKPVRTLFISMDDVLMTTEWDKNYGERYVKRPGVDKMLLYLSSMYDIYLVSTMDSGAGIDIAMKLDKDHVCAGYLFKDSLKQRNMSYIKDISYFSRDPKRCIIIDYDLNLNEQKENVICVRPFKSSKNLKDTTLLDVIPILDDIFMSDEEDVRTFLSNLEPGDSVVAYKKYLHDKEIKKEEEKAQAFLQQINVFKQDKTNDSNASNILLADPELEGVAPALAANNMQAMMTSSSSYANTKSLKEEDQLKYIPVEVNGEKPEGFVSYWQREYIKKKEGAIEMQQKMLEMQSIAMKEMQSQMD